MNEDRNIVIFSTYPVLKPRHGGQFRAEALLNAYRTFGNATYVAICNSAVYTESDCSTNDIRVPQHLQELIETSPQREQILIGKFASEDFELNSKIQQFISKLNPQIVVIEQPYLWPAVKSALTRLNIPWPTIIYSSHNVEAEHYEMMGSVSPSFDDDLNWIANTENELVSECNLIIATTTDDLANYSAKKEAELIALVNNGFSTSELEPKSRAVRQISKQIKFKRFALFVASAHKPNIDGFLKFVGTRLGFLPPETGIVIVGTAGPVIGNMAMNEDSRWIDLFWNKIQIWGFASEIELSVITDKATLLILPISDGGGSNLKTAQALQCNKPVVCTNHALRGFDATGRSDNLLMTNTEARFKELVSEVLSDNNSSNKVAHNLDTSWDYSDFSMKLASLILQLLR